jgi:hypothetical protein
MFVRHLSGDHNEKYYTNGPDISHLGVGFLIYYFGGKIKQSSFYFRSIYCRIDLARKTKINDFYFLKVFADNKIFRFQISVANSSFVTVI